ncbi:N-acetylmuramoyl-L-alanine amidase [Streptomyces catenulae]|uniref:N-acetylmuramoyl-L-alanine amidase n=1 Tax=Streptomyces catenulae TaxID=66875 RepID=A0ABV2Z700_9ACTN|nr:N-acetylmuramoyl-L-alanine amidase [Streptomyces catenulae]
MAIDRRTLLRGTGRAAALGAAGSALAAGGCAGPAGAPTAPTRPGARRLAVPRPPIVPRTAWQTGAQAPRDPAAPGAGAVKAVFLHHTGNANDYTRADVPDLIRAVHDAHVTDRHWDDIGYNFLVDRTGTLYEGRTGSIAGPEVGAHTEGFNLDTVGIAAIGHFGDGTDVPAPLLNAVARLAAWKLGLYGVPADGHAVLYSSNDGSRFPAGTRCVFATISGHRDGCLTHCPGSALYARLPQIRARALRLQRRGASAASARAGAPVAARREEGSGPPGRR